MKHKTKKCKNLDCLSDTRFSGYFDQDGIPIFIGDTIKSRSGDIAICYGKTSDTKPKQLGWKVIDSKISDIHLTKY